MNPLPIEELQRIVTEAARGHDSRVEVVGVMPTAGDDYAEVIVTFRDCLDPPCEFVVGVRRDSPEALVRKTIAAKIGEHTAAHADR
jgi:hypothetical protein